PDLNGKPAPTHRIPASSGCGLNTEPSPAGSPGQLGYAEPLLYRVELAPARPHSARLRGEYVQEPGLGPHNLRGRCHEAAHPLLALGLHSLHSRTSERRGPLEHWARWMLNSAAFHRSSRLLLR